MVKRIRKRIVILPAIVNVGFSDGTHRDGKQSLYGSSCEAVLYKTCVV